MALSLDRSMRFLGESDGFRIVAHPVHPRLYHVALDESRLYSFLADVRDTAVLQLEYVPYERFILAKRFDERFGLKERLRAIVRNRASGGFTLGLQGTSSETDDHVRLATAVSYLLGPSNFDAMSGKYYARFEVRHSDESDSYLRKAYHPLTLHTDGTYVDETTDWLLMMKIAERCAEGGESRLLHLDDWSDLKTYAKHPLGSHEFTYKSPPSKNVSTTTARRTFFRRDGGWCMAFIDQFIYPDTIAQAEYLKAMLDSAETAPATMSVPLPPGDLIVLNNLFWLHGRAAFREHPDLHRELLRQRGSFSPD